ncbi:hypothetical protein BX616_008796, partial [Lobosporangium transversale]
MPKGQPAVCSLEWCAYGYPTDSSEDKGIHFHIRSYHRMSYTCSVRDVSVEYIRNNEGLFVCECWPKWTCKPGDTLRSHVKKCAAINAFVDVVLKTSVSLVDAHLKIYLPKESKEPQRQFQEHSSLPPTSKPNKKRNREETNDNNYRLGNNLYLNNKSSLIQQQYSRLVEHANPTKKEWIPTKGKELAEEESDSQESEESEDNESQGETDVSYNK